MRYFVLGLYSFVAGMVFIFAGLPRAAFPAAILVFVLLARRG